MIKIDREEEARLRELVDKFSEEMLVCLVMNARSGKTGWHDPSTPGMSLSELRDRIILNVYEEDWIDVANLAAMAWHHLG